MPTLPETRSLALGLFDELGQHVLGAPLADRGWTFGFDRARVRLGACHPESRRITLSARLVRVLPSCDVEDTIRHEIAHAIDLEIRGKTAHDGPWKQIADACGASPERLYQGSLPSDPGAPYRATCPSCEGCADMYRQPVHPRRCRACHEAGLPAYLRVVHQQSGRVVWDGGQTPGPFRGTAGFSATCPSCGEVYHRSRRPQKPTACGTCCERHAAGAYDPRYRLDYARLRQAA
ncbi:MAG: SprT-like domain-containing protein [Bacteroidota bacterium]